MKEYFTAKSYQNYERVGEPFLNDKNKLVTKVKTECPRCSGKGIIISRVENGKLIPIPVDGGICYSCLGKKYIEKIVRLYTKSEYERMEKANEKAKEKRRAEQEEKMKREFAHKKKIWDKTNGFNEDGYTYIILGNSFSIKDQLKEAGFRYSGILKRWMKGEPTGIPQDYKGEIIKLHSSSLVEYSAWGEGHFLSEAKKIVDDMEKELIPEEPSEWIGEVGKRMTLTVSLVRVHSFQNYYGISNVYNFKDEAGNEITWFSKVDLQKDAGDVFKLAATVKDHSEYNGKKQTIITRARLVKD